MPRPRLKQQASAHPQQAYKHQRMNNKARRGKQFTPTAQTPLPRSILANPRCYAAEGSISPAATISASEIDPQVCCRAASRGKELDESEIVQPGSPRK
jgi:hypothetical protein